MAVQFMAIAGIVVAPATCSPPLAVAVAGLALIVLGFGLSVWALAALGPAGTPTPVPRTGAPLRRDGAYRWVRHPIYTGVAVGCLGLVLRAPSPMAGSCWAVLVLVLTGKAAWEERMLRSVHPEYAAYAADRGRFLPRLRRH